MSSGPSITRKVNTTALGGRWTPILDPKLIRWSTFHNTELMLWWVQTWTRFLLYSRAQLQAMGSMARPCANAPCRSNSTSTSCSRTNNSSSSCPVPLDR